MKNLLRKKWAGLIMAASMSFAALPLNLNAQCPGTNIAYNGDMLLDNGCAVTTPTINACLTNWAVSHGSPTPIIGPPNGMWIWSYYNMGEGVYMGHNFIAGRTYCITFEASTNTHDGTAANPSARFWLQATNALSPGGVSSNGEPIPVLPAGSYETILDQNWATTGSGSGVYNTYTVYYTPTNNWSQLWFYPESSTLPQVELAFRNVVITDVTQADPCDFEPKFEWEQKNCKIIFNNVSYVNSSLTVLMTQWDFGDGTTSTDWAPEHYYANPGTYVVTLNMWVTNGTECCYKTFTKEIRVEPCDPCESLIEDLKVDVQTVGYTATFTATNGGPYLYAYLWDFGDGTTGTGSPVSHAYAGPGWYNVCVTVFYIDKDGRCCSKQVCQEIYIGRQLGGPEPIPVKKSLDPFIMDESLKERPVDTRQQFSVQPNPGTGTYMITCDKDITSGTLQIMDINGKVIRSEQYNTTRNWRVNIEDQPAGTYFLKLVSADGKVFSTAVIKE